MSDERNPWSVRGVSREARAKAAKAAQRRRMTMGAWVDHVLATAANNELSSRGAPGTEQTADTDGSLPAAADGLARRVDDLERRERELEAIVDQASERGLAVAESPAAVAEARRAHALTEAVQSLVARLETVLRPVAQIGLLVRRLDASEERQRQMLALMERMAVADQRRAEEMAAIQATLARLEARLGRPLAADAALLADLAMPEAIEPRAQPFEFTALHERAVANSRRSGQRPPDETSGLMGRLFGRRAE